MKNNLVWIMARTMAEDINGGSWELDYTTIQQRGWYLKAAWTVSMMENNPAIFKDAKAEFVQ